MEKECNHFLHRVECTFVEWGYCQIRLLVVVLHALQGITVIGIAVLAFVIAWNPNSSIMGLVSNAWAGLGSAFGPIVVMSLFWRRTNLQPPEKAANVAAGYS